MAVSGPDGVVVTVEQPTTPKSHMDWGAVIAGGVMAAAISFVLMAFGSALGLSFVSPQENAEPPGTGIVIIIALWTVIVTVASFSIGGYVAGRMRRRAFDSTPHEVSVRDAVHGLVVWGLGVLIGGALAATAAAGIVRTGAQIATAAVGAGVAAVGAAAGDEKTSAYFADALFRAAATPASAQVTSESPDGDQMLPPEEPRTGPVSDAARQEAARILAMGAVREGGLTEADKEQLARLVASEVGVPEQEARGRVDTVLAQAEQAANAAEMKARDAADAARKAGVLAAFLTVTSLLVGAAGTATCAKLGGRHRDEGTGLAVFFG